MDLSAQEGMLTREISNENLACSHLVEVAHVNTIPWETLCIEYRRAGMHKYSAILLVEVFDRLRFWVELYGSGDRRCKFLVRKIDTC